MSRSVDWKPGGMVGLNSLKPYSGAPLFLGSGEHQAVGIKPAVPGLHQPFGFPSGVGLQMQHPPWTAPARAALGVGADRTLLLEKIEGLLQHGFGKPQLGFVPVQLLQQSGGIVVVFEQAFQNPADGQFQVEELRRRLTEILFDICKAGA